MRPSRCHRLGQVEPRVRRFVEDAGELARVEGDAFLPAGYGPRVDPDRHPSDSDRGAGDVIQPGETLIFVVDLVKAG